MPCSSECTCPTTEDIQNMISKTITDLDLASRAQVRMEIETYVPSIIERATISVSPGYSMGFHHPDLGPRITTSDSPQGAAVHTIPHK